MDDNKRIELWAESVIFSEEFFTILHGDENNAPDTLGAAMYLEHKVYKRRTAIIMAIEIVMCVAFRLAALNCLFISVVYSFAVLSVMLVAGTVKNRLGAK